MSVKRYSLNPDNIPSMEEDPSGEFVRYEDWRDDHEFHTGLLDTYKRDLDDYKASHAALVRALEQIRDYDEDFSIDPAGWMKDAAAIALANITI